MRWIYLIIIILFAAATIVFAFQNLEIVNVSFLGFNVGVRMAILVFAVYVLGTVTGSSLFALLRRSYEGVRRSPGASASARRQSDDATRG
jgi:lipopolysaccharide assembly protein A